MGTLDKSSYPDVLTRINNKMLKIILILFIFLFIIFFIITYEIYNIRLTNYAKKVLNGYAEIITYPLWNYDIETVKKISKSFVEDDIVKFIILKDNERVFYSNFNPQKAKSPYYFSYKTLINYQNNFLAYLTIYFSKKEMIFSVFYLSTGLLILLFTIVIIVHHFFIEKTKETVIEPLTRVTETLKQITLGKYNVKFPEFKENEFITIINDLKEMVLKIVKREIDKEYLQNYLKNIMDSMPSSIISLSTDNRIENWNKAAELNFGFNKSCKERYIWEVIPELTREHIDIDDKTKIIEKLKIKTLSNEIISNVVCFPLIYGKIKGKVIRIDDVSEIVLKEHELFRIQKMEIIGTLISGITHDFNNLLTGITGSVSILKLLLSENPPDPNEIAEILNTIDESVERAVGTVKQLLNFVRKDKIDYQPIDLNKIIKHVIKISQNSFDKSIKIIPEYYDGPAMINGNYTQIEQVLMNLAINSNHAMTIMRQQKNLRGGKLFIKLKKVHITKNNLSYFRELKEGYYWLLRVEDTGVGMDENTIEHIFDPFFTTKSKEIGSGLGMTMVYSIVKNHNGTIKIKSKIGKGTRIDVYLPVFEHPAKILNYKIIKNINYYKRSGYVLIVDDEKVVRKILKEMLVFLGFNVVQANNGEEAIDKFNEYNNKIKIAIVDLIMPDIDGIKLINTLKKLKPDLKFIVSTGATSYSDKINDLKNKKNVYFLNKPYSMEELSEIIKKIY